MEEFGVKAVAQYTGINAHTLRIWERRFQIVTPSRSATGRRVYSKADADKLCLVALLVAQGHAISSLAKLPVEELQKAVAEVRVAAVRKPRTLAPDAESASVRVNEILVDSIVTALEAFRLREISAHLSIARLQTSVREFIFAIVMPLINRIGVLVAANKLSIAHEHALSAILKTHIYQAIYSVASASSDASPADPKSFALAIATQEGDFHEFGVLLATLLAIARHIPVHFFGCNMPASSLAFAVNALRSPIVLVGKTYPGAIFVQGVEIRQKAFLKELDRGLVPGTEIWIGGHAEPGCTKFRAQHKLTVFATLAALDQQLAGLAVR